MEPLVTVELQLRSDLLFLLCHTECICNQLHCLPRTRADAVAWTLPLTLLHQARACPFKSARLLYLRPTMKLSRTNCTVRSPSLLSAHGEGGIGWA